MTSPALIHEIKGWIEYFESKPEHVWCVGSLTSGLDNRQHCALGHAKTDGRDPQKLAAILNDVVQWEIPINRCWSSPITRVNDGSYELDHYGKHPRTRVLSVLKKCLEKVVKEQETKI